MNKVTNVLVGLVGGATIAIGAVEASVVTGAIATVSQEASTYASVFGAAIGALVGLFKEPLSNPKPASTIRERGKDGGVE